MKRAHWVLSAVTVAVMLAACGGGNDPRSASSASDAPKLETHSAPRDGVFSGVRWRFDVTKDPGGRTCRTELALSDDGPSGLIAGECVSLDRFEAFRVITRGIESGRRLSYAAGIHSPGVKQLRLAFKNGSFATGPVEGDVFLVLWEGVDNVSRIEFLDDQGRMVANCNFFGDANPC